MVWVRSPVYFYKRGDTFYFSRAVPSDLQHRFDKRKVEGKRIWLENGIADDGGKYEGEIENGKPNGKGTLIYRNGTRYVGEYLDGTWNGQGSFYFPDGEKWVGEFKEDAPWNITWFDRDGNIIVKWGDGVKQK